MSRIGKFTVAATLLLPLTLGGCGPKKGTANPEDYFPLIQVALAGGETAAMIGHGEFVKTKNFGGCVAASTLITAFDGANQVLSGKLQDKIVIPAVDIDVSDCLALREAPAAEGDDAEAGDENASLYSPVTVTTMVAGYGPAESSTAPPAEEPSSTEPPAEEAPAEEAPAEEPAAEESAAEEAPAELKGNPDAAALLESISGITMMAVLHYATKLKGANCKKGTAALGALNYINGMIKPVADEIAEPDGKISIPAMTIDLSECADG